MLIYEQNSYIFPLIGEVVEGGLDSSSIRFGIDDEEVLLGVWRSCYVLYVARVSYITSFRMYAVNQRTPTPARSRPVTESSSPMTARNCLSL